MVDIIAEVSSNWVDKTQGKQLITRLATLKKETDMQISVKFQLWRARDLYGVMEPYVPFELSVDLFKPFFHHGREVGVEVFSSVFYPEAVRELEMLGVSRYKLASRTIALRDHNSKQVIEAVKGTGKPVVCSTGMGVAVDIPKEWTRLYCIPSYPAKFEEFNVEELRKHDGYSNHIPDSLPCVVAVALGAKVIETHVKPSDTVQSPDSSSSLTLSEFRKMVLDIGKVEALVGGTTVGHINGTNSGAHR